MAKRKGKDGTDKRSLARLSARQERHEREQKRQREDAAGAAPDDIEKQSSKRDLARRSARLERQERMSSRRTNQGISQGMDEVPLGANSSAVNGPNETNQDLIQDHQTVNDTADEEATFTHKNSGILEEEQKSAGITASEQSDPHRSTVKFRSVDISTVKITRDLNGRKPQQETQGDKNTNGASNNLRDSSELVTSTDPDEGPMVGAFAVPGIGVGAAEDSVAQTQIVPEFSNMNVVPPMVIDGHLPEEEETDVLAVEGRREPDLRKSRRDRLLMLGGCIAAIVAAGSSVGAILVGQSSSDRSPPFDGTSPVSAPTSEEDKKIAIGLFLSNVTSHLPVETGVGTEHEMAVRWIIEKDPMNLKLESPNLIQRFALALFYYQSTDSGKRFWRRCNPPETNEKDECNESGEFRWLTGSSECLWHGIGCTGGGAVAEISLIRNGLIRLSEAACLLSNLQRFGLHINPIVGTIPEHVYSLTKLTVLQLASSKLSGSISTRVGLLTDLEWLSFAENGLSGNCPSEIGKLTRLTYISLALNPRLDGSIPEEIFRLTKLSSLALHDNSFTGTISAGLGSLNALRELLLQSNHISGHLPKSIGMCSQLEIIQISETDISGTLPSEIGRLSQLNKIVMGRVASLGVELSGTLPEELFNLTALTVLGIFSASFHGTLSTRIGLLSNLLQLILTSNQISGTLASELGLLTSQLNYMRLDQNDLNGTIPAELSQCTQLAYLNIRTNSLSGTIPDIHKLQGLQYLNLGQNRGISGTIPDSLFDLQQLATIRMSGLSLKGTISSLISQLTSLEHLNVPDNQFNGTLPSEIGLLSSKLHSLSFAKNKLIGEIPGQIGGCAALTWLHLGFNMLTGHTINVVDLQTLRVLALNDNSLSGSITTHIARMTRLEYLSLSHNPLTGMVPTEIGLMTSLESFFLEQTMLTGAVGGEVCALVDSGSLSMSADCLPAENTPLQCDCCTFCCDKNGDCVNV